MANFEQRLKQKEVALNLPTDEEAYNALLGEVGPYGIDGMRRVASSIRNRNMGLRGVYGHKNPNVINKRYTPQQLADAKQAWEESKTTQFTDAYHWFSDADLKQPRVQEIIKKDKLEFIENVGRNNFYRRPKK